MHSSSINITLVGRTGAGKSSLANAIARQELFTVGYSLNSETEEVKSMPAKWPVDPYFDVKLIDSPGFGDNRPNITNEMLLSKIIGFLNSLQGGLHIALFCIPAKTRIDTHDIRELELLGLLLGQAVFKHVYIVITQCDRLRNEVREKTKANFVEDLFKIYADHNLPPFSRDKLLFADLDNLTIQFLEPLGKALLTTASYKPKLARGVDPNDPESLQRFLADKELKPLMDKYEAILKEERKKSEDMHNLWEKQRVENQKLIEENIREQETAKIKLYEIQVNLDLQKEQNQFLKEQQERQKEEQEQQLQRVQQNLDDLSKRNASYEAQLQSRQAQIESLTQRIYQVQAASQYQPRRKSCNMF